MSSGASLTALLDRSWTDSLTGTVFLADMNLPGNLPQLLKPAERSSRTWLPTFLHEAMHHWCFQSPVAQAIALLQCRARRRAAQMRTGETTEADREQLMEDVMRSEATSFLLQPLAEGLALFMEFDAVPGASSTLSAPMVMALPLFTNVEWMKNLGEDSSIAEQINRNLFETLSSVRLYDEFMRRKTNLLAQPLASDGGGYLAGYMTVKLMRNWALRECDGFSDSDFAAMFLRHFFYDDWGLVATLLDDDSMDFAAVNAIALHLQKRVRDFFHCDFEAEIKRFQGVFGDGGDLHERQKPYGTAIDPDLMALGVKRAAAMTSEFESTIKNAEDPAADETLRSYYVKLMHQRQLLRLGVVSVRARVSGQPPHHRATALLPAHEAWRFGSSKESKKLFSELGGVPILTTGAMPHVPVGEADGRLEVYTVPHTTSIMVILSREHQTVAQMWVRDQDGAMERAFGDFVPTAAFESIELEMRNTIAEVLKDSSEEIIMKSGLEGLPNHRNEIYARWALGNVRDDAHIESCRTKMWSDGVLGLDGMTFSLLRSLARLSVAAEFSSDLKRLREIDTQWEWNAIDRLPELDAISDSAGLSLLIHNDVALAATAV